MGKRPARGIGPIPTVSAPAPLCEVSSPFSDAAARPVRGRGRRLLDMEGCIEAMAEALTALERGEVTCRSAPWFTRPGENQPARADARLPRRRDAAVLAEDGVPSSRTTRKRARRTPGHRHALRRRRPGRRGDDERVGHDRDPHRRGLGGSDAAARARGCEGAGGLGAGVQARSHLEAMSGDFGVRHLSRSRGARARRSPPSSGPRSAESARRRSMAQMSSHRDQLGRSRYSGASGSRKART